MIRIWQSYACNNSVSYRLVARFADPAKAQAVGTELAGLFQELLAGRDSGLEAMAQLYGFPWEDEGWGSEADGPHVVTDGSTLMVHHGYCLGLGPGVPAYLVEQGAQADPESTEDIHVSVLFRPPADPRLNDELAALFALPVDAEGRLVENLAAPWAKQHTMGKVAWYRDAGVIALFFPIDARDFVHLRTWLGERGIEQPIVRIEAYDDQDLLRRLGAARCTACDGRLEYLDPRLHDIESPQLVCKPCGGLYDLTAFR